MRKGYNTNQGNVSCRVLAYNCCIMKQESASFLKDTLAKKVLSVNLLKSYQELDYLKAGEVNSKKESFYKLQKILRNKKGRTFDIC